VDVQVLSDLWFFHAAARHDSLTAAARQLCVTQGAVSQRILRLEARLGIQVFTRGRGGIALTPAGRRLAQAMDQVGATLQEALADVRQAPEQALVVSCGPSLATEWLVQHLPAFHRRYPGIRIEVRAELGQASATWMQSERIDVLVAYAMQPLPGLHELAQVTEFVFPVASPACRSAVAVGGDVILLHDDAAWLDASVPGSEWGHWRDAVGTLTLAVADDRHFNLAQLAYQAAVDDQGVALGRAVSTQRLVARGELVPLQAFSPVRSASYRVLAAHVPAEGSAAPQFAAWMASALRHTQTVLLRTLQAASAGGD
jgi:LysR family glycine cleavage system transcriptional activator